MMSIPNRRKRNTIYLDTKVQILDCLANGEGSTAVARIFGLNEATVRTIKNNEAAIRNSYSSGAAQSFSDTSSRSRTIKAAWYKPPNPIEVVPVPTEQSDKNEEDEPIPKLRRVASSLGTKHNGTELSAQSSSSYSSQPKTIEVALLHKEHIDNEEEESMSVTGSKEYTDSDGDLETKVEILDCLANGQGSSAAAKIFGLSEATVRSIKKNESAIWNSYSLAWHQLSNPIKIENDEEETMPELGLIEHSDNDEEKKPIPKLKMKPKRSTIYLNTKIDILNRLAAGQGSTSVARHFGLNEATVRTIKKNEAAIMKSINSGTNLSARSTAYTRDHVKEKTEKVLAVWIEHNVNKDVPIHQNSISRTALSIYKKIKAKYPNSSPSSQQNDVEFTASNGWVRRFFKRNALSNTLCTKDTVEGFNDDILQADIDEFIEDVLGYKENNDSNEEEEGPILSLDIIEKALKLANELSNHFIKHDPNKRRAEKFQRDLNLLMAPYTEIDRGGLSESDGD